MEWAVRGGSDYLIGETFNDLREAKLALDVMKTHGNGKNKNIIMDISMAHDP